MAEHQTNNLAVTGSNPVPPQAVNLQTLKERSRKPKGGGRLIDQPDGAVLRKWNDGVPATLAEAMQCVDTAFAHAAFDGRGSALPRCEQLLASQCAWKRSDDAAIATAQTALRVRTCDQRSLPLPEGLFLKQCEPLRMNAVFIFL
jgi:hypothetical protein